MGLSELIKSAKTVDLSVSTGRAGTSWTGKNLSGFGHFKCNEETKVSGMVESSRRVKNRNLQVGRRLGNRMRKWSSDWRKPSGR